MSANVCRPSALCVFELDVMKQAPEATRVHAWLQDASWLVQAE
jgi:hypothetical protein